MRSSLRNNRGQASVYGLTRTFNKWLSALFPGISHVTCEVAHKAGVCAKSGFLVGKRDYLASGHPRLLYGQDLL